MVLEGTVFEANAAKDKRSRDRTKVNKLCHLALLEVYSIPGNRNKLAALIIGICYYESTIDSVVTSASELMQCPALSVCLLSLIHI